VKNLAKNCAKNCAKNWRLFFCGLALLCAGALEANEGLLRAQRKLDFPGTDSIVGQVWFQVERTKGDHIYVKSLTQPTLGMGRTKGQDNLPLGLVECLAVKRTAIISPEIVLDIALARCPGGREYVVDEVLFDVEHSKGEKR
jgi:hypothetical protein